MAEPSNRENISNHGVEASQPGTIPVEIINKIFLFLVKIQIIWILFKSQLVKNLPYRVRTLQCGFHYLEEIKDPFRYLHKNRTVYQNDIKDEEIIEETFILKTCYINLQFLNSGLKMRK